jgi:hypothetical protein
MAADKMGRFNSMRGVSIADVSVSRGITDERAGTSKTSSYVKPSALIFRSRTD